MQSGANNAKRMALSPIASPAFNSQSGINNAKRMALSPIASPVFNTQSGKAMGE